MSTTQQTKEPTLFSVHIHSHFPCQLDPKSRLSSLLYAPFPSSSFGALFGQTSQRPFVLRNDKNENPRKPFSLKYQKKLAEDHMWDFLSVIMKNNINNNNGFGRKGESSKQDSFHVIHKLPPGDSPYVRAKYYQLVEKDPDTAIVFFWEAINVGDRVDSALKDMAVVMKQQDRAGEAIEAIRSVRDRCSKQAQESLDNVLIDLYKKCGKLEEQIELLKRKLRMINQGEAFNGKPTKTARSHGRKFQVSIRQETSRILGNLGWAYMQQRNYAAAEAVYRKAQEIDPDANKACNLCVCLMKQAQYAEARGVLEDVLDSKVSGSDETKSRGRADELLEELKLCESKPLASPVSGPNIEDAFTKGLDQLMNQWAPFRSRRLPIFEEISPFRNQLAC